jgi:hypothetical protein
MNECSARRRGERNRESKKRKGTGEMMDGRTGSYKYVGSLASDSSCTLLISEVVILIGFS